MSKGKQRFLRTDLMRAIKAAKDAAIEISEVRIAPTGEIVLKATAPPTPADALDHELQEFEQKHGSN